jgi:hypothetical protein
MLCPVAQQQADSSRIGISIGSRKKQQPGLGVRARAAAPRRRRGEACCWLDRCLDAAG